MNTSSFSRFLHFRLIAVVLLGLLVPLSLAYSQSFSWQELSSLDWLNDYATGKVQASKVHHGPTGRVASYDAVLTERYFRNNSSTLLNLRTGAVDPQKEVFPRRVVSEIAEALPSWIIPDLDVFHETAYRVVQFDHSPLKRDRDNLTSLGARIVGFLPNTAYMVTLAAGTADKLAALPGVRWQGELPKDLRFDESLVEIMNAPHLPPEGLMLQVSTWNEADLSRVTSMMQALGARIVREQQQGVPHLIVFAQDESLRYALALLNHIPLRSARVYSLPVMLNSGSTWLLQSGNEELEYRPLFDYGLTGYGQIYASADSGLDTDGCQFRYGADAGDQTFVNSGVYAPNAEVSDPENKIIAYYLLPSADAYDDSTGGYHGTMTNGCAVGDNYVTRATQSDPGLDAWDGMAPAAQIVFQDAGRKTGELSGLSGVGQYSLNQQAYQSGARVHNDSYGLSFISNGYDSDSKDIDQFLWEHEDYAIFFSAGNSGPEASTLGGEGSTSKNTLAVGASTPGWYAGGNDLVTFSSRGPTEDGRLKPDLVAPGVIVSATENEGVRLDGVLNVYGRPATVSQTDPGNNQCSSQTTQGTSFSSPTAAGMALLVRQYFEEGYYPSGERNATDGFTPTNALLKAVMLNGCQSLTGDVVIFYGGNARRVESVERAPSDQQGFGRINLDRALYFKGDARQLILEDVSSSDDNALATGDEHSLDLVVRSGEDLRISLVWTDPAAESFSGRMLINDLDLELHAPDGSIYLGNRNFVDSYSTPISAAVDEEARDTVNPVENIFIANPQQGTWTVTVKARSVPGNGQISPHPSTRQGYALLMSGDIGENPNPALAQLTIREAVIRGGCDNDASLERNEKAYFELTMKNTGVPESQAFTVRLDVDENGSLDPSHVAFRDGQQMDFPAIPSGGTHTLSLPIRLDDMPESLCDETFYLKVVVETQGEDVGYGRRVRIPMDRDLSDDGTESCQENPCNGDPTLSGVDPDVLTVGQEGITLDLNGQNLEEDTQVRFVPDVLSYDEVEWKHAGRLRFLNVSVDADAEPGPVTVELAIANDDEFLAYEGLLTLVAADGDDDDDEDLSDGDEAGENNEDGSGSDGGCTGTASHGLSLSLLLAGLSLAVLRRRRGLSC